MYANFFEPSYDVSSLAEQIHEYTLAHSRYLHDTDAHLPINQLTERQKKFKYTFIEDTLNSLKEDLQAFIRDIERTTAPQREAGLYIPLPLNAALKTIKAELNNVEDELLRLKKDTAGTARQLEGEYIPFLTGFEDFGVTTKEPFSGNLNLTQLQKSMAKSSVSPSVPELMSYEELERELERFDDRAAPMQN